MQGNGSEESPLAVSSKTERNRLILKLISFTVPFDYCERPPIISHGFMRGSSENAYHVLSEVQYECHNGYRMKGSNSLKCHATGCWTPNDLPECIREDLYEAGWAATESTPFPIIAILISISVGCAVIALMTTICLIVVCRRKGGPLPPPAGPAHWSTTVTVTPECRPRDAMNQRTSRQDQDRMALIAFADGVQVTLPSYEEALRDSTANGTAANGLGEFSNGNVAPHHYGRYNGYHNGQARIGRMQNGHSSSSSRRSRHPAGGEMRYDNSDSLSHHSVHAWPTTRQHR